MCARRKKSDTKIKHIKSKRTLEVDYKKLKQAIRYVARLHNTSIREFAQHQAHVYNDIIYFLTKKERDNFSIRLKELNNIFTGFGLNPERFIYVPGVSSCGEFNPEYDLMPESISHIKDINRFYSGKPKLLTILNRQISYKIKNFNVKIKSFEMYMTFVRSFVIYLRCKYKDIPISIESTLDASKGNEIKIILRLTPFAQIHILLRLSSQRIVSCIDMVTDENPENPETTLRQRKFKQLTITLLSQYTRFIEREQLRYKTI